MGAATGAKGSLVGEDVSNRLLFGADVPGDVVTSTGDFVGVAEAADATGDPVATTGDPVGLPVGAEVLISGDVVGASTGAAVGAEGVDPPGGGEESKTAGAAVVESGGDATGAGALLVDAVTGTCDGAATAVADDASVGAGVSTGLQVPGGFEESRQMLSEIHVSK